MRILKIFLVDKKLENSKVYLVVVENSKLQIIIQNLRFECMKDTFFSIIKVGKSLKLFFK